MSPSARWLTRATTGAALLGAALLAGVGACSSDEAAGPGAGGAGSVSGASGQAGASGTGAGAGQAGAAGAAGGEGGAAGSAGSGGSGQAGSIQIGGGAAGQGGAAGVGFEQCATGTDEAKPRPVDLYVMLDRSGSMVGPKWTAVTAGLMDFFQSPGTSDLRLGLQFFPLEGAGVCDFQAYGVPAVAVSPLPGSAVELNDKLSKQQPGGETPTLPALQGAYEFTKGWAQANPERAVAVLLATDDEPNVCASTLDNVAQVAKNARSTDPPIATFVIGVGNLSKLDAVADAGGTGKAFLVDGSGSSTKEQFVKALGQIRDALVVCTFPLPEPEGSESLDPGKVNVTLTPPGSTAQPLVKVSSLDACADGQMAWSYEPPEAPTQVTLCPAACAALKGQAGTRVDLVFGCASLIK